MQQVNRHAPRQSRPKLTRQDFHPKPFMPEAEHFVVQRTRKGFVVLESNRNVIVRGNNG